MPKKGDPEMDAVLDSKKFAASLRKHFALPVSPTPYLQVDRNYWIEMGPDIFVEICMRPGLVLELDEEIRSDWIPDKVPFRCDSLRGMIDDDSYFMESVQDAVDAMLLSVPVAVTLPSSDEALLSDIDLAAVSEEKQLSPLIIQLVIAHKSKNFAWESTSHDVRLGELYSQDTLANVWAESQVEGNIQFRVFT